MAIFGSDLEYDNFMINFDEITGLYEQKKVSNSVNSGAVSDIVLNSGGVHKDRVGERECGWDFELEKVPSGEFVPAVKMLRQVGEGKAGGGLHSGEREKGQPITGNG